MHDILGDTVAFFLGQFLAKAAHELAAPLSANAMAKLRCPHEYASPDENIARTLIQSPSFRAAARKDFVSKNYQKMPL